MLFNDSLCGCPNLILKVPKHCLGYSLASSLSLDHAAPSTDTSQESFQISQALWAPGCHVN